MSWFGWGEQPLYKDKNGKMIDTSKFGYAYEFFLACCQQPEQLDEDGYALALKFFSLNSQADYLSVTKTTFTDMVRHADASDYGGKGCSLIRYKR